MSKGLRNFCGPEAEETAVFVEMLDKWFDALNVCNINGGKTHLKLFKNPYRSPKDIRITVSKCLLHCLYCLHL